ncbi:TPA: hypothetical protein DCX16_03100 [bacterium]|nr:hypothetical protein [bacterium]
MKKIFFTSIREYSGTSAVVIGTVLNLLDEGKRVGYLKTFGYIPIIVDGVLTDADSGFVFSLLGEGNVLLSSPLVLTEDVYDEVMEGKRIPMDELKGAYNRLSSNKDVFVFEGGFNIFQGACFGLSAFDVAYEFNLPVILVERYSKLETLDRAIFVKNGLSRFLKGIVLNMVRDEDRNYAEKERVLFEKNGIPVLGTIPFVELLSSCSIRTMSKELNARVLCGEDHFDRFVSSILVGAMDPENAITFFKRKRNLVVVTGGDRSDIHIAALEANVSSLVLTGGFPPSSIILSIAHEKNIPILLVEEDTLTTAKKLDFIIGHSRTHEKEKLSVLKELIKKNVDIAKILGFG